MFSGFEVFSEMYSAVLTKVGTDCKLSEFPGLTGFGDSFLAVRTYGHGGPFSISKICLKRLSRASMCLYFGERIDPFRQDNSEGYYGI